MIPQISVRMVVIVVLGVFLGSALDAIAGGGGIVTVPAYLLAGLPIHWALGTNKLSAGLGTIASAARYVRSGLVIWRLALPCIALTLAGSFFGTKLQLMIPEVYLKFLLLAVLPVVAFFCLRKQSFSEGAGDIDPKKQMAIVCAASLLLGAYNGFYGPGTGTFLLLVFCGMAKLDVRRANGNVKLVNAGVGGTPSTFGLMRYQRDVVERVTDPDGLPDIVIIEFSVNDWGGADGTPVL